MEQLRRILARIQAQLGKLTPSQKLLIGTLAVVGAMTLFLVTQYAGQRELVPLMPGTAGAQQQEAARFLAASHIPHQVADDGTLMVSPESRLNVLSTLGEARKLPDDSTVLFSNLIDKQHWLMPRGQQKQLENLAKMNQLAMLIAGWTGIASAEVFIDAPEPRGLGSAYRHATASISVMTEPGHRLDQAQADSMARLVAGSTAGLDVENVRITDGRTGRSFRVTSDDDALASTYLDQAVAVEDRVRIKVEQVLAHIPGALVAVTAIVDGSTRSSIKTRVLPKGEGSEAIVGAENITTSDQRDASSGDEAGVRSNEGLSINDGASVGSSMTEETSDTEFVVRFGEERVNEVSARGRPTKINVAVSLTREYIVAVAKRMSGQEEPDGAALAAAEAAERERVATTLGPLVETAALAGSFQEGTIVVSVMPVSLADVGMPGGPGGVGTSEASSGLGAGLGTLASGGMIRTIVLGVLALVALTMMVMMVRKATRAPELPTPEELVGVPPALEADSDLIGEADETDAVMAGIEVDDDSLRARKMLDEVGDLVKSNPDSAASLFRGWMAPEP